MHQQKNQVVKGTEHREQGKETARATANELAKRRPRESAIGAAEKATKQIISAMGEQPYFKENLPI